jgi:hypothetical protein
MIFLFIADLCNLKFHISKAVFFLVCIQGVFQRFLFLVTACKSTACPEVIDVVLVAWGAVWCPIQLGQSSVSATIVY